MMVSCPGCNNQYSIDERKVPAAGASMTCRECGKKWKVKIPAAVSSPPSEPQALSTTATPAAVPQATESSPRVQKPVNCPKCGHLFVPYLSAAPQTTASGKIRKISRPHGKILLVEDQNYFAELTREALGEQFETIVASNLRSARSMIQQGQFDLVILDLSLEDGQDGAEMLQATRQRGLPVLIFTARDETELYSGAWDQLRAAGATDILIKGMNVGEELRQKVQSLLSMDRK